MAMSVTAYERYRDFDESPGKYKPAVTITSPFNQQELEPRGVQSYPPKEKFTLQYSVDEIEITAELASVMQKYRFVPVVSEGGLTYFLQSVVPSAIPIELEQEIDLVVRMSPKAVRNTVVLITARNKGIPNPIL
jgi:hypothetical protein